MLSLGDVVRQGGRQWVIWAADADGSLVAVRMPEGETAMGLGRSWSSVGQPQMVIPAIVADPFLGKRAN